MTLQADRQARETQALLDRFDETLLRSKVTCARSVKLQQAIATSHRDAQHLRETVAAQRRAMLLARTPLFLVCGLLDDDAVEARWVPGHGLMCPPSLIARAEVVMALGETFSQGDDGWTVAATLDTPLGAMLTLMRAMSQVTSLDMLME